MAVMLDLGLAPLVAIADYESLVAVIAGLLGLLLVGKNVLRGQGAPGFRDTDASVDPPTWWPAGAPLWRAYDRTLAPSIVGVLILVLFLAFVAFSSSDGGAVGIAKAVLAAGFVVDLGFVVLTAVFARPRSLVPYRYRRRPNLLEELGKSSATG
jgi:hypothetical protein